MCRCAIGGSLPCWRCTGRRGSTRRTQHLATGCADAYCVHICEVGFPNGCVQRQDVGDAGCTTGASHGCTTGPTHGCNSVLTMPTPTAHPQHHNITPTSTTITPCGMLAACSVVLVPMMTQDSGSVSTNTMRVALDAATCCALVINSHPPRDTTTALPWLKDCESGWHAS